MRPDPFNPAEYETKWQERWEAEGIHRCDTSRTEKKYYCLDMFPYPSGSGLHVGHPRGYVLSDVWSRYKRFRGYNVLHPIGWDVCGLPAENDDIRRKIHPSVAVDKNVKNFKRQLKAFGCMYDWSREINTAHPDYYRWTQWIFLKMFDAGLAYRKLVPINWCDSCKTGIANEEVIGGRCERCGSQVLKKDLMQWMLRITRYAQRLLEDLDKLEWPEMVKILQKNWIGRSEGAEVIFKVPGGDAGSGFDLSVFTTRPDTLFGATYMVMAPEHPLVEKITTPAQAGAVGRYVSETGKKSDLQRSSLEKEKTGVFTGAFAVNPVNGEHIPIWISDYVLLSYGTGAIMAVPAHDERDFEFATKFGLKILEVIEGKEAQRTPDGRLREAYTGTGLMIHSADYSGLDSESGGRKITHDLEKRGLGRFQVNYKLRDWVFSRQRYWGEPIPIVHCDTCGEVPVPEEDLPVTLPEVENYEPTGTGESPLAGIDDWVNVPCPKCGGPGRRETNTMAQWAGSCWYFLRYISPDHEQGLFDPRLGNRWMPVDQYVGGIEHAILHLLYARFYIKFLYDIGVVAFDEPFKKLFCIGMVTRLSDKSGKIEKMSKSKGNVVGPDEIIQRFGTDTLRLYELFIGPPDVDSEWSDSGIVGIHRFLKKAWDLLLQARVSDEESVSVTRLCHRLIHDVTDRLEGFKFNTAISAFMEFVNGVSQEADGMSTVTVKAFLVLLSPFAPHFACELWERLRLPESVFEAEWPVHDAALLVEDTVEIGVQVGGKFRGSIRVPAGADQDEVVAAALRNESIHRHVGEGPFKKVIYVRGRILNLIP